MVDAIKKGTYCAFRTSLMRLDALFIDNIWLLQNRRQTALAVFSLFESFADKGGLVLIASDLPPSLLSNYKRFDRLEDEYHTVTHDLKRIEDQLDGDLTKRKEIGADKWGHLRELRSKSQGVPIYLRQFAGMQSRLEAIEKEIARPS